MGLPEATQSDCNLADPAAARRFEEHVMAGLREAGLRITMTRIQVIRELAMSHRALTVTDIHRGILAAGGRIDIVSVYRILTTLQELGMVHRIGIVDGYLACRESGDHGEAQEHFVCSACGCVAERMVDSSAMETFQAQSQDMGFTIETVKVEILGTCSHCHSGT
jgi:Fe2+ or Zn2+ uptake regulation protein